MSKILMLSSEDRENIIVLSEGNPDRYIKPPAEIRDIIASNLVVDECDLTCFLIGFEPDAIIRYTNHWEFLQIINDIDLQLYNMIVNKEISQFVVRSDLRSITYNTHSENETGECIWPPAIINCTFESIKKLLNFLRDNKIKIIDVANNQLRYV
jgi:hypothetical protein